MPLRSAFLLASTLAGLVVLNSHGSAAGQSAGPAAAIPRLEHTTFTLKNGLKVIFSQDKRLPMVAVNLWYHVGPANEIPGRTGFAHLFEHMMFQGSKHVASDTHFKLLEVCRRLGHQRHHGFRPHQLFRDRAVERAGARALDRIRSYGLSPRRARSEGAANQIEVVRNERRQSVENQPYGVAHEALYQALYPSGHPYHAVVIGSHADLAAAEAR